MRTATNNMMTKTSRKMQDSAQKLIAEAMLYDIPDMLSKNESAELKLVFTIGLDCENKLVCTGKMQSSSKEIVNHSMIAIVEDDQPDLFEPED